MIYVDELRKWGPRPGWRWTHSCHLVADTLAELHAFAKKIGMKRQWFQDHPKVPHYDLTAKRRAVAVSLGAKEITSRELILMHRPEEETAIT